MNRNMKMKMITIHNEDQQLIEDIKKEMMQYKERTDLQTDEQGNKRFNGLIFVPRTKEKEVIERFHDDIREGHPQRSYYFPGMFRKIKKYISMCEMCNKNKNKYEKPKGEMTIEPSPPEGPWEQITADFLEMPPTCHTIWKGKMDELLVIVDTFSKQTILIPTRKTATTEEIFHLLWERVFAIFGVPKKAIRPRSHI